MRLSACRETDRRPAQEGHNVNDRHWYRSFAVSLVAGATLLLGVFAPTVALGTVDTSAPTSTVKYVFVHHSTGDQWLQDSYGGLAASLGTNNYFVSDTNYGWGPDGIGNNTDIGDWWTWFRGTSAGTYTGALYANTGINSSYARSLSDPSGENTVVMFKSCFPNSAVGGSPSDAIPAIGSNPLAGTSGQGELTVGNAKGVYLDLLEYFKLHPDKLFVLVTSPPLREGDTNPTHAANARALANWLVDPGGLLNGYSAGNVFVFDYYTVLTGGHHRVVGGAIEHTPGPSNYLAYPTGDSHPSAAGDVIATAEFVPMLNAAYNSWHTSAHVAPTPVQLPLAIKRSPSGSSLTYKRRRGVARFTLGARLSDARGRVHGAWIWLQKSTNGRTWRNVIRLRSNSLGMVAKGFSARKKSVTYYRWYVPATASDRATVTSKQRVRVK
jgi:hypothetical protein